MSKSKSGMLPISKRLRLVRHYRVLSAENTPEQLISWLNAGRTSHAKRRVTRVVQLLQQQQSLARLTTAKTDAERQRHLQRIQGPLSGNPLELDDLLARYWLSPRVFFFEPGPRMLYATTNTQGKQIAKVDRDEIAAAMCVLRLAVREELDRVRKCDCDNFFLARRLDQIHCSTNCRIRHHQSSEDFKAKRRKYLREWYRLKKSGKVR